MTDTQAEAVMQQIGLTVLDCLIVSAAEDHAQSTGTKSIKITIITQLLILQTFAVEYPKHARRMLATLDPETQAQMRQIADQIAESLSNA